MIRPHKLAFWIVFLTVVQFNMNLAQQPESPEELNAQLILEGVKLLAPFTDTAVSRLHTTLFGKDRAARSTDVIIFNASSKTFKLTYSKCLYGGFSTNMFPEHKLLNHHSTVFGIESNGFLTGVFCEVKFNSINNGSWAHLNVKNPYFSKNKVFETNSDDLFIVHTRGQGHNNQARFIIYDA